MNSTRHSHAIALIIPGQDSSDKFSMKEPRCRASRPTTAPPDTSFSRITHHPLPRSGQQNAFPAKCRSWTGNRLTRQRSVRCGKPTECHWCEKDLSTTIPPADPGAETFGLLIRLPFAFQLVPMDKRGVPRPDELSTESRQALWPANEQSNSFICHDHAEWKRMGVHSFRSCHRTFGRAPYGRRSLCQ